MLLVATLCPTAPLHRAFPRVPFLSLRGRTPLVAWFSTFRVERAADPTGMELLVGDPDATAYAELTLLLPLHARAVFVPRLVATSALSLAIARHYDMPKVLGHGDLEVRGSRLVSGILDGARGSAVRARLYDVGKLVARLLSPLLPLRVWPARFPSGTAAAARLMAIPRFQFARITDGRLSLDVEWLPPVLRVFPLGVYLPRLRITLPGPSHTAE